jgi:hypothetical protein
MPGKASAQWDSWLTLGITGGDLEGQLTATGLNLLSWGLHTPLRQDPKAGGGVSFSRPDDATPCHVHVVPLLRGKQNPKPCASGPRGVPLLLLAFCVFLLLLLLVVVVAAVNVCVVDGTAVCCHCLLREYPVELCH